MLVRPESLAVTKLELFFHDVALGPATGFLYRYGQHVALVSNWHCFSGMSLIDESVMDGRYFPNRVEFNINVFDEGGRTFVSRPQSMPLCSGDESFWWQHEDFKDSH
jgi:hypothetical protein